MKRGYPFTSGNLNYGYSYNYTPKSSTSGSSYEPLVQPAPGGPSGLRVRRLWTCNPTWKKTRGKNACFSKNPSFFLVDDVTYKKRVFFQKTRVFFSWMTSHIKNACFSKKPEFFPVDDVTYKKRVFFKKKPNFF